MQENRIISALIGLIGACSNNPKTENTDHLVIKALASSLEPHTTSEIVNEIRTEKNRIAPGCMTCTSPCGNTSDYDMERIYNADEETRHMKLNILSEISETAKYIYKNEVPLSEKEIEFFYKALSYMSYDLKTDSLLSLLDEAQDIKRKIKEM
ncbi:MAG: hypothetical protein J1F23_07635 [Oscillospiraceae bacterium]|nr:hypothetical protein [Oscillospiraceae bacterium]